MQFQSYLPHEERSYSSFLPGRIHNSSLLKVNKKWESPAIHVDDPKKPVCPSIEKPLQAPIKEVKRVKIESPTITYQVWPGGPYKSFVRPKDTKKTNKAATKIQRAVRGHCARTNFKVMYLEHKLATMEQQTESEIQAIHEKTEQKKIKLRRKATKKEAKTLKKQLVCSETANEGSKIIHFLRLENKKLRNKNQKIAAAIHELKIQNERLESSTAITGDNQNLLGTHYEKIKETNDALNIVVPKYEAKVKEMKEELECRRQYCLSEHKMKVMYVKLVATLAEMVEHHSKDQELIEEVVSFCLEIESEHDASDSSPDMLEDTNEAGGDEYDEVSVVSDDGSDSNNYDDYTVATMDA